MLERIDFMVSRHTTKESMSFRVQLTMEGVEVHFEMDTFVNSAEEIKSGVHVIYFDEDFNILCSASNANDSSRQNCRDVNDGFVDIVTVSYDF